MLSYSSRQKPVGIEVEIPGSEHPLVIEKHCYAEDSHEAACILWEHDGFKNWEGVEYPTLRAAEEQAESIQFERAERQREACE